MAKRTKAIVAHDWVQRKHPLYIEWEPTWRLLGEAYEGDGGFRDGTHLVAHPRELNYLRNEDGTLTNTLATPPEKVKFKRRRAIARYENFARTIVDTLVAHQYQKGISRSVGGAADQTHPLDLWWQDVDGQGTHIDDYLEEQQTLADTYGYVVLLMDLERLPQPARTRAEQAKPFLRSYIPLDMPDWLTDRQRLTAVKFVEAVVRTSLDAPERTGADAFEYRCWDAQTWRIYAGDGRLTDNGPHPFGECPVVVLRARKRTKLKALGLSVLGDPMLYKDHYNLVSELRELERSQTFSMINIPLGPDETLAEARSRLGDHSGTDNIIWTKGGVAQFIAPPDGPTARYAADIEALERKMFRLIGLPWEGDSRDAEAADSRRLKAMDLNRLLANLADEAERVDYAIARLWFIARSGAVQGQRDFEAAEVVIKHPDEFHVEQALDVIETTRESLKLGCGKRFDQIVKQRAVPVILPDLPPEDANTITQEIEAMQVTRQTVQTERDRLAAIVEGQAGQAAGQPTGQVAA